MTIQLKKFGQVLISRPAGKEAYLAAKAYTLPKTSIEENIEVDFEGVDVLAPSWADEFLTQLQKDFPEKVSFINTENSSVKATLKILGEKK